MKDVWTAVAALLAMLARTATASAEVVCSVSLVVDSYVAPKKPLT